MEKEFDKKFIAAGLVSLGKTQNLNYLPKVKEADIFVNFINQKISYQVHLLQAIHNTNLNLKFILDFNFYLILSSESKKSICIFKKKKFRKIKFKNELFGIQ